MYIAAPKTIPNPIGYNVKCCTNVLLNILFISYLFSYLVMATTSYTSLDTQSSGTDLEEVNTEDELNTDTSKWSEIEKKKLQHMTEFHTEYQRVFGKKASLCTIIKKRITHMNPHAIFSM